MQEYLSNYSDALDILISRRFDINPDRIKSLKFSAKKSKLEILLGFGEKPIGFVSWAGVNKDSVVLFLNQKRLPTYFWEYDEGNIAFIQDIAFKDKWAYQARKKLIEFIKSKKAIFYVRKNKAYLLIRKKNYFKRKIFILQ